MTVILAMILDALVGEPRAIWSRVPHPAVLIGRAINIAEQRFNDPDDTPEDRRRNGTLLCAALVIGTFLLGVIIAALPLGGLWEVLIGAVLLAQRSLSDHVRAVADALRLSVGDARIVVARIVGRDTSGLDGPATSRAAIESAAENFSDGVVAPLFWFLLAGLPGLLIYKAVNTADSMIGYKNEQFTDFGWASARLDDVLNFVPARLTALLIMLAHGRLDGWGSIRADAALHRSPNAGWPEAAMARVLDVALAGPRSYNGQMQDFAYVHPNGRRNAGVADIDAAVAVIWRGWAALLGIAVLLALL